MSTDVSTDVRYLPTERRELAPFAAGEVPPDAPFVACAKLSEALALARDRCKPAAKDSVNRHHNFAYASADSVVATARAAMEGTGLALIPLRQKLRTEGTGDFAFYCLDRVFVLTHSSGEFTRIDVEGWPVIPEKGRPLDKAFAIALTSSLAYVQLSLLQIERKQGENPPPRSPRNEPPPPELSAEAYAELVRGYHKQADEAETVEALRHLYDVLGLDERIRRGDRTAIQAAIVEHKKRIYALAATGGPTDNDVPY